MEILLITMLALMAGILLVLILRSPSSPSGQGTQLITLMHQQVEALRSDVRSSLQDVTNSLNQQLISVTNQIQNQTANVGNRLDSASRIIGDVQKNLGELGQATKEIKELGQSVSKLEELLKAPKLRGGLGEYLLEDLLKQVLPSEHFSMYHQFRNGQIVDAVIYTSDRLVPIDSKFPLENFRKIVTSDNETEKKNHQRSFISDVKKHIDSIAEKYIVPDEGTFPFALMYIPAENIYYEIIIKDGDTSGNQAFYSYAIDRKVIPVSPNSFYAYLQVIALGLRGLHIEESAREIFSHLVRMQNDLVKIRENFDTLGTHIQNARNKYEETDKRLQQFENKMEGVSDFSLKVAAVNKPIES